MAYLTDTNQIPESTMESKGLDILVLDALHHRNHLVITLEQAVEKAYEIGAKHTYHSHEPLHGASRRCRKDFERRTEFGYDG